MYVCAYIRGQNEAFWSILPFGVLGKPQFFVTVLKHFVDQLLKHVAADIPLNLAQPKPLKILHNKVR